ncbi:hypothetical protein HYZ78_02625 [Candidatus Microgenomates bacterium]|nr:hypothetical protein [Candidatus Microgenomates bacterium]
MHEKEQYLGLLNINGKLHSAFGDTPEEVDDQLQPILKEAKERYHARSDWDKELRIFRVEEIDRKQISHSSPLETTTT